MTEKTITEVIRRLLSRYRSPQSVVIYRRHRQRSFSGFSSALIGRAFERSVEVVIYIILADTECTG